MENGVDLPKKSAEDTLVQEVTQNVDLPEGIPVFLFVGRLMWYKGIRLILEALAALRSNHQDFRMVFVGRGTDEDEIKALAEELQLTDQVFFLGALHSRDELAAWYTRADLFLFPSTFDTNGLVIREAAACSLGSVLVRGSCAAEGVTEGVDGLLIDETAASLAVCLSRIMEHPEAMHKLGENAAENIYISWNDAVKKAEARYQVVIDNYLSRKVQKRPRDLFTFSSDLLNTYEVISKLRPHGSVIDLGRPRK